MNETIPPTKSALSEAFSLSADIMKNIELSELPLANIALKTSRLARLLNDFEMQKILEYEIGGYPNNPGGVPPDIWKLAVKAGRNFKEKDKKSIYTFTQTSPQIHEYVFLESINALEEQLNIDSSLASARDPEVPRPPRKILGTEIPDTNSAERWAIRNRAQTAAQRLASRRNLIYQYVVRKHYELKFSGIASDIFGRIRERVDEAIGNMLPDSIKRFTAVYENLVSDNPEDWSNAVHSCRRILQDLADLVFPPTTNPRIIKDGNKEKKILLGKDNYINRIVAFIEDKSDSEKFQEIAGSHIKFIGERLDSVFDAANKGSHTTIVSREEADRYVVFTYLLVGDILTLYGY